ncbi:unnamed protein product [Euphydryas editha]|uniref:Lysosomal-trafficking regulator n=1 Tax=Euphydryas editha TaxID=104508 RepID=A0AAU9VCG1_EUPED|nr:unnamed protein product [Euphydryas editha]
MTLSEAAIACYKTGRVPALFCSSGSSSPECSSSEESAGAPYASEHSEPRAAADDGYEADVEISKLELSINMKTKKQTDLSLLNDVSNIQAQDVMRMDCPENNKSGEMVHPELCVIVVDILSQLIDKLLSGGGARAHCEEVSRVCGVLARAWAARGARAPPVLRRLLAPDAPAARLLALTDPAYTELQRSVLELVQAVGAHSLEAGELAALLRPLAAARPPLALLLAALRALLARARAHTPDHILSFPVDPDPAEEVAAEEAGSSCAQQAELAARRLRLAHLRAGVWSPWAAGGARCALGGGWAPWLQGFAVALWLRLHCARPAEETKEWQDEPPDPDEGLKSPRREAPGSEYMHVFSIGHDSLLFELWINTTNGSVSVRLSRPDAMGSKLVSVGRARTALAAGARWRCLALNVAERVHKRRIHIQRRRCLALNVAERVHKRRIHIQVSLARTSLAAALPRAQRGRARAQAPHTHTGEPRTHFTSGGAASRSTWPSACTSAAYTLQRRRCLALNVAERVHKRRIHIQVSLARTSLAAALPRAQRGRARAQAPHTHTGEPRTHFTQRRRCLALNVAERVHKRRIHIQRRRCLALNVAERVHKRRIHIQVTIYVDGRECETLSLPLQGILVRKATPCSLLLGQAGGAAGGAAGGGAGGALHVGGVRVYRAPVLAAPGALHLAAHGPDLPCQIPCESANFPSIITPELLELNIDWDSVYEISSQTLRELHDNLLLTFYPHAPDIINLYHQAQTIPTVFGGRAAGGAGGGEAPEALRVRWSGAPRVSAHRGFAPALLALGGPDLLFYLFARTVELRADAEEQASALALLLRACSVDARLAAQLHAGALDLLLPVLAARHARVNHHMLKVILDEACSSPILLPSGSVGSHATLLVRNESILLEPRLVLLLMRAWRHFDTDEEVVWEESGGAGEVPGEGAPEGGRQRGSAWLLALAALGALLAPAHPHRAFNYYQACRVDLLRHLLHACKERFLNSSRAALSDACSARLVALIRALLGAPPPLPHLALLADFLLLMHQASDTFVTHSRANFYFLLTPDTPETSDFNFLNFINKRRKLPTAANNKRLYDTMERSSSSSVSSEAVSDAQSHDQGPHDQKPHNQEPHDQEPHDQEPHDQEPNDQGKPRDAESNTDPESTSDSTKQLKGLINMQIKESRQKQLSSSENSDAATERSTENTDEGLEKVVKETTSPAEADSAEQLYTGSIYQQRRVRTGAEPGWRACEGLLLLLRDALHAAGAAALAPDTLVVLANHGDAGVRAAVVRAAAAARLPPRCLPLLANQIALYPCSWELATACAVLLTGCDVPLEDQLDEHTWATLDEEAAGRAGPLLALLPRCAREDAALAHNVAALLRRLVDRSSLKALNEVALVEAVVRAVRAAGQEGGDSEGRDLVLEDLYDLLCRVAVKVLAGNHSMQV